MGCVGDRRQRLEWGDEIVGKDGGRDKGIEWRDGVGLGDWVGVRDEEGVRIGLG